MPRDDSFDELLARLRAGDEAAAAEVFSRFRDRLIALARSHLEEVLRHKEDPEDVVQSVFRSFFRRQREGQFTLESWENIWSLLTVITLHKCGNRIEYFRAARRNVHREVPLEEANEESAALAAVARDPTPQEAAVLADTLEGLMRALDEVDQEVLSLHLQDYTVPEISRQIGYAERTVWRTLERIRKRAHRLLVEQS
jgi:RNA polymerase sigma-70 factor (ECF subfamily)